MSYEIRKQEERNNRPVTVRERGVFSIEALEARPATVLPR